MVGGNYCQRNCGTAERLWLVDLVGGFIQVASWITHASDLAYRHIIEICVHLLFCSLPQTVTASNPTYRYIVLPVLTDDEYEGRVGMYRTKQRYSYVPTLSTYTGSSNGVTDRQTIGHSPPTKAKNASRSN
jgi:hypothetical protein